LIEYLEHNGSMSTNEARSVAPKCSDDSLVRDFNYFLAKKLVRKEGKTKSARYYLLRK
jgi:hypothetical protein